MLAVLALSFALPPACLVGFLAWLNRRSVIVGQHVLTGLYVGGDEPAMAGLGNGHTARRSRGPGKPVDTHFFRVGGFGYAVRWRVNGARFKRAPGARG